MTKVYKVHYDAQHPERSHVTEYTVKRELVQVGGRTGFKPDGTTWTTRMGGCFGRGKKRMRACGD